MAKSAEDEIQEMIDHETKAWDSKDAEALVDIFHPDMVWPWPKDEDAHDPVDWVCPMGRYDRVRWKNVWQKLFDSHKLVHNRRRTVKITVTNERECAFAVVDVDTLWHHCKTGEDLHWKRRAMQSLHEGRCRLEIDLTLRIA